MLSSRKSPVLSSQVKRKKSTDPHARQPGSKPLVKRKKVKKTSILDRLFFFFLFLFAAYSAFVCPVYSQRPQEETPATCRALFLYRTHILEPYFLPPLKFAYDASPPIVDTFAPYARPLVHTAQKLDSIVRPKAVKSYDTIKAIIVPWYSHAFLPRWNAYVAPRLRTAWNTAVKRPLEPYFRLLHLYSARVQRHLHGYLHLITPYWTSARPHVYAAAAHAQAVWSTSKPYVIRSSKVVAAAAWKAYKVTKPIILSSAKQARLYGTFTLQAALDAKRQYVDPHILKILEKVHKNQSSSVVSSSSSLPNPTSPASPTPTKHAEVEASSTVVLQEVPTNLPVMTEAASAVHVTPSASPKEAIEETKEAEPVSVPDTPTPKVVVVESTSSPSSSTAPNPTAIEEELKAVSVAMESAEAIAGGVREALATPSGPAKDLEEGVNERLADQGVVGGVGAMATSAEAVKVDTPTGAEAEEEVKLDDFLSDLGIDLGLENSAHIPPTPSPEPSLTPEEIAAAEAKLKEAEERLKREAVEALAARRKEIVDRHMAWQRKVDELEEEQERRLFIEIEGVRVWAVGELGVEFEDERVEKKLPRVEGLPQSKYQRDASHVRGRGLGSKVLEGLNKQGERFVRGLETYLASLESKRGAWAPPADLVSEPESQKSKREATQKSESAKWSEVVSKVEEKFAKTTRDVQAEVHNWYVGVRGRETDAMLEAANAIKVLGERAQADIAMDYAWLDDVTTLDWAKYHELMDTWEDFQKTALAIQNGSYIPLRLYADAASEEDPAASLAPANDPLIRALDRLQREFEDVVAGFGAAVRGVRRRAEEVLAVGGDDGKGSGYAGKGEKGEDVRVGLEERETGAAAAAADPSPATDGLKQPDPKVSVGLPVGAEGGGGPLLGDSRVLVGKDPVQIEQAIRNAVGREEL